MCSTTSCELRALRNAVKDIPVYYNFIKKLWNKALQLICLIDSNPLLLQRTSGYARADPDRQGELEYVLQQTKKYKMEVHWIPTHLMRADRQTKFIASFQKI
jgi:hypothetical protein